MRTLLVVVAALGLAFAGAGVALAAPAYADTTGFTGQVDNLPVFTDSPTVDFGGTLETGSSFSSITIANDGTTYPVDVSSDCTFTSRPQWSCSWETPDGGLVTDEPADEDENYTGPSYITIVQADADGTTSTDVLTFDVYDVETYYAPDTSPYVAQDLQFRPGGVRITTSPSSGETNVGTTFYALTPGDGLESRDSGIGCPAGVDDGTEVASSGVAPYGQIGAESCNTTLSAGMWGAEGTEGSYVIDEEEGGSTFESSDGWSDTDFTIPSAPTVQSVTLNTDGTATIRGAGGFAGQNVQVLLNNNPTDVMCRAGALTGVAWSCTTGVLADGSYSLSAVNQDVNENQAAALDDGETYASGGLSAATSAGTLVVAPPATTTGLITPVWTFTIEGDTSDIQPGDTITVDGAGLPAGTTIDIVLHSTPIDLGSAVAATDGTFSKTVTIPEDAPPGDHQIIITASGPGLVTTTQAQPLTLVAPASSGTTTTTKPPTGKKGGGSGRLSQGIQPNILTKALTPISDVVSHPSKIAAAVEIGLVLLLLAVLPAHLLNATLAEQSDRFERRFRRFPRRPQWLTSLAGWFTSAPVGAGIVVTLLTAILFGFADPTFGFTLASLRLVLAAGIALFLVGYVANALTAVIARTQWNITVLVNTRPYGLILTVVGVVISRLLHFSPGFLIGLILGLTIQGKSAAGFAWRTVVTRTVIVLVMGIAAWIGYSSLTLGGNEGGTFGTALLVETLVAITTEGVVALLVELLPLRFLEGERVYAHSRVLWAVLYLISVVVFVVAVIPWEGNWSALGSALWIWAVILAAFALLCLGVYIYFRRFAKPLEEEAGSEEVSLAETVRGDGS